MKKIISNKIINWNKKDSNKEEWLTIEVQRTVGGLYKGGGRNRQIKCTKNHKFIYNIETGGEISAEKLKKGDYV